VAQEISPPARTASGRALSSILSVISTLDRFSNFIEMAFSTVTIIDSSDFVKGCVGERQQLPEEGYLADWKKDSVSSPKREVARTRIIFEGTENISR
jgi:hypothetical protein